MWQRYSVTPYFGMGSGVDLIENQGRSFIYHATSESTIEDNDDGRIVVVAVEVDLSTVSQYTGLKDKNGNDI